MKRESDPARTGLHGATTDEVYRHAGFGVAVPRGNRPALVVVDLTRGFTEPGFATGSEMASEVAAARRLLDAARHRGIPVILTAISFTAAEADGDVVAWLRKAPGMRALREGSSEVTVDPRLDPQPSDHLVIKKGASAFHGTSLATLLSSTHVDTVVLCGATTSGCVRATAVDSVQAGFDTVVVGDACGDRARGPHDAALFDLQAKYADVVGADEGVHYLSQRPTRSTTTDHQEYL